MDPVSALLPVATLILGAVLAATAEAMKHRRERRESISDALRESQAAACIAFLDSAHDAAHLLGRAAPGCPFPLDDLAGVYWRSESDVAKQLRRIEMTCRPELRESARGVLGGLRVLKRAVEAGARYEGPEYLEAYERFRSARNEFIRAARDSIQPHAGDGAVAAATRGR